MSEPMGARRLRVLFVCWGYSIHARRRIQIFIDDPRFEVAVVSTHDYAFAGAANIPLTAAVRKSAGAASLRGKISRLMPGRMAEGARKLLRLLGLPGELRTMMRDLSILRGSVARIKPDVVFLQTLQYPSFLALRLPRDLPMIVTFWNGDLTHFAKWTGLEMLAKKRLVMRGLRRVDAITVNSGVAFEAAVGLGAAREKITLVRYPGADLTLFQPRSKEAARKRLAITARHVVLCPRGLGALFNSDTIVEAAARVLAKHADTLFLFISGIGGAEEWKRHLEQARALGIADRMRWDGQVPWEEMPWYYGAADAMVSIMTADSCPNCMLEAMACGVPVVMSDTPQNREWIEDGASGFLCPARDAAMLAERIATVLDDRANIVEGFARSCLEKVRRDANSAISVQTIKSLVVDLAHRHGRGG